METTKPKRLTDLTDGDIAVLVRHGMNHQNNFKYNDGKPKISQSQDRPYDNVSQGQQ